MFCFYKIFSIVFVKYFLFHFICEKFVLSPNRLCKRHSGVYFLLVRGVIYVVFVHVVNIEKFQYLYIIVKGLMCQAEFLSCRNHCNLRRHTSQRIYCSRDPTGCLSSEFRAGKKHVFCSSVGCRGGGCQTLACALGVLTYVLILLLCSYM